MKKSTAAYLVVYEAIKARIIDEQYPVDSLLPPEPVLEKLFGVSRTTVRRAVEMLSREGYVNAKQGIGTIVLDYKTMQNLNTISSFTETLSQSGHDVTLRAIDIGIRNAADEPDMASLFGLSHDAKLARIMRVACTDGTPIAIIRNYLPYEMVDGIEGYASKIQSLYSLLREQYFINIEMARDRITARAADAAEAVQLDVPVGFPLLCVKRIAYVRNKPACCDILAIRSDMYGYNVSLYEN
ncbi:MAG: GntR family transcriptional regulator [Clostridia bacterium]|nr:GntR family transcriptional regulator [Clostridia bacterium]